MKKLVSLFAVGSMALTLAACGGNSETTTNTIETNVEDIGTVNEVENVAIPEPSPSPSTTPAPTGTGKEFDSSTTQDDAEATGMTSRVNRDDGGNDTQPAQ